MYNTMLTTIDPKGSALSRYTMFVIDTEIRVELSSPTKQLKSAPRTLRTRRCPLRYEYEYRT